MIVWRAALIVVSFAVFGLTGPTAAAEGTTDVVRSHLEQDLVSRLRMSRIASRCRRS